MKAQRKTIRPRLRNHISGFLTKEIRVYRDGKMVDTVVTVPKADPLAYCRMPPLPKFLDRSKWSKKQWAQHEASYKEIEARMRAEAAAKQEAVFRRVRRMNQLKKMRAKRKEIRQADAVERKRKKALKVENRGRVLSAVENGRDTAAKIAKALRLEVKEVSSALRYHIGRGRIKKLSAKRYASTAPVTKQKQRPTILGALKRKGKRPRLAR